jgi:hypothetical protein
MVKPVLNYEKMVEDAMRGVVREALRACIDGIPGAHHFFISFRTRFQGVKLADYIRARYPDEMTIVLQHQYWGLEVTDDRFEVTLSFNRIGERLVIPFHAITKFADPSAKWVMEFQVDSGLETALAEFQAVQDDTVTPATPSDSMPSTDAQGAQVVALDAFRKK